MEDARIREEIAARAARVRERIAAAACRAGRTADQITLVAVSKTWEAEVVAAAYRAGLRVFGENRVEEAGPKAARLAEMLEQDPATHGAEPPIWHMIGHLQSRKAKEVLPWASLVHSVDSEKLARRLSEFARAAGRELPILLEVNVSGEESKYGVVPDQIPGLVEAAASLPGIRLEGLMTMAPIVASPEEARPVFRALRQLRDRLVARYGEVAGRHLSMGMTDDFEIAVEEGATIVRIGRAIFGERYGALHEP